MLKLYTAQEVDSYLDNTDARALVSGHNRRLLSPDIRQLFLRNDDAGKWHSDIVIRPVSVGPDVTSGANGFGVKLYWGSLEPTERIWSSISWGNEIRIPSIGKVGEADQAYKPLWIRVAVAPVVDIGLYEATLEMDYVEHVA